MPLGSTRRGAFALIAALLAAAGACSNGTEPKNNAACTDASAQAFTVGQVQAGLSGTSLCVAGGPTGAEYALVPFNSSTTYSSTATINITSVNATAASGTALSRAPQTAASFSVGASDALVDATGGTASFDMQLRERERRQLPQLFAAARAWKANASRAQTGLRPSFTTTTYTVGQLVQFNVNADSACSAPDRRTGRVVAITDKAIVVADTNNPAGGYTDAEYQSIGVNFDTLVYNLDVSAFGAPSDIDGNGKVILLFTRAVNELTPANSGSVVGGFFYARDLFPVTASNGLEACPTSNQDEMFYLIVPDPTGVVNSNVRTKASVQRIVIGTTAHEFQHLINASRRLYVNTGAQDFEVVWLNEGLSHIAEELLFYHEAGLAPRQDFDSLKLRSTSQIFNAFINDQSSNFGRYGTYLPKTTTSSPYAPNDSLQTRGATWSFLRYAADQTRPSGDGDLWFRLVNSTTNGIDNLNNVLGGAATVTGLFRDWATSHLMDDIPNTPERYQQLSYNWRSLFMTSTLHNFPLATQTVSDATPLALSLKGGSVGFVRFKVAANQSAQVTWANAPSTVLFTAVRFR